MGQRWGLHLKANVPFSPYYCPVSLLRVPWCVAQSITYITSINILEQKDNCRCVVIEGDFFLLPSTPNQKSCLENPPRVWINYTYKQPTTNILLRKSHYIHWSFFTTSGNVLVHTSCCEVVVEEDVVHHTCTHTLVKLRHEHWHSNITVKTMRATLQCFMSRHCIAVKTKQPVFRKDWPSLVKAAHSAQGR